METLTERQQRVLDFIGEFIAAEGMPPTRAEIARALGFRSANAAEEHLRALARKGAIEMLPGASRGIRLRDVPGAAGEQTLPLIGRVAAGQPILAAAHVEARYLVERTLFKPRADYLVRVRGESMRNAGILDGDLLAVHSTPEARDGQVVVARLDDEVTVKRFRRRGSKVRLLPENPAFEPIEIDLRQQVLDIEGIGVGVLRAGKAL